MPLPLRSPLPTTAADTPLLSVRDLRKEFPVQLGFRKRGAVSAVDGVSFDVQRGHHAGHRGRVWLRQVHRRAAVLGLIEPDCRRADLRWNGRPAQPVAPAAQELYGATCRWSSRTRTRR